MRAKPYVRSGEFWAPVSSLSGARLVQVRAAANQREAESIDLLTAYLQVFLGGPERYFIILEKNVLEFLEGRLADKALQKQAETGGDYGIRRCISETVKKLKQVK